MVSPSDWEGGASCCVHLSPFAFQPLSLPCILTNCCSDYLHVCGLQMELAAAQDAEEEDWTRTHVRAIERCYMAYKTRQTINELVRKNQRTLMPTGQDLFYNPPGAYMDQSQAAYNQQSQAQYPQQMMAQQAYFMPGYQMPVSQMGGYGAMMVPMQAQDPNQQMQMQQMQVCTLSA